MKTKNKNKKNKTTWYYIWRFFRRVFCILVVVILLWNNFYRHSVYYAEHTPHDEDAYPELVMFTYHYFNLPSFVKVSYHRDISDGSLNSIDGRYSVSSSIENGVFIYSKDAHIIYELDSQGKLKGFGDGSFKNGEDMTKERAEFEAMLADFLKPVKEDNYKPLINLQWLFDKIYEGRFVDK